MGTFTDRFSCNIHTVEIATTHELNVDETLAPYLNSNNEEVKNNAERVSTCVSTLGSRRRNGAVRKGYRFIINVNKWNGERENVWTYSEFKTKFRTILEYLCINGGKCSPTRVDLKFDIHEPDSYEKNKRIMFLLMADLQHMTNDKNFWIGEDAETLGRRSLKLSKKNGYEFEFYNKEIESDGKDWAVARFEIRELKNIPNNNLKMACLSNLHKIGDALEEEPEVIEEYTDMLREEYERRKPKKIYHFLDDTKVTDRLFTSSMLLTLITKINNCSLEQAKKVRDNFYKSRGNLNLNRAGDSAKVYDKMCEAADYFFKN